ncbi:MAG: hypothetical protein J5589_09575 [Firmicutes bacterium]|nr:hypothetical protein [Bacillota bacterium]
MLSISAFTALFGAVYEYFSFGVWSYYMVYAFAPSLLGGLWLLKLCRSKRSAGYLFLALLECAVIVLTFGMILSGVVAIYGSENRLLITYPILGLLLLSGAVITRLVQRISP